jgi:hypothetical protein
LSRKSKHGLVFSITFPENLAVYEIMWKKYGTARQATEDVMRHMSIACGITTASNTFRK